MPLSVGIADRSIADSRTPASLHLRPKAMEVSLVRMMDHARGLRWPIVMLRASNTSQVFRLWLIAQPTIRREKASSTPSRGIRSRSGYK